MILCIDSGNSRIKWGIHDGVEWLAQGAVAQGEAARLTTLCTTWSRPEKVILANVAGESAGQAIVAALAGWQPSIFEVRAGTAAGGVVNRYQEPSRLGVDRWCALLGAWALYGRASVVVMAGTATTVDTLDASGAFIGGLILPGFELMRRALARDTAALPFATGQYAEYPRRTEDAIISGCLEAQAGAIERAWHRQVAENPLCIISGGNAEVIGDRLVIPYRRAHNLPLEGLKRLAFES